MQPQLPTRLVARPTVLARGSVVSERIEQMIAAAVDGDYTPLHRLNRVLAEPYTLAEADTELSRPPLPDEVVPATFCGT